MKTQDIKDKEEMETRFALSNVLRNIINKSENGEIALAEFIEEIEFVVRTGKEAFEDIYSD
jgi:hypothetical protein